MIIFWFTAAGLVCLALAFVLPPLWRSRATVAPGVDVGNLPILQEQRRQLELELAAGQLSPEQHQEALDELGQRVLDEVTTKEPAVPSARTQRSPWAGVWVGILVPALGLGLYAHLGAPQAMDPTSWQASAASQPDVGELNAMVDKLAERMNKEPQNIEGWTQLGRAYALMQRFEEASRANQHAIAISPPNAQLLVDQADVLAMLQGKDTLGEPERLIVQALQLDPRNLKALTMAGSVAFERRDFAQAIQYWARALPMAPAGSDLANMLEGSLAAARSEAQASGQTAPAPAGSPMGNAGAAAEATAPVKATQLTGIVRLAPALASRVSPGDTLFIFARAAQGPRMPLAIVRATAQGLPLKFTLDDNTAMSPQTKLSQFEQVIVGARISKSGQALPQSGDLIGQSAPTSHTSQGLEITIDSVQP